MTTLVATVVCFAIFIGLNAVFTFAVQHLGRPWHARVDGLVLRERLAWRLTLLLLPGAVALALVVPLVVDLSHGNASELVAFCERMHAHCDLLLQAEAGSEAATYGVAGVVLSAAAGWLVWRLLGPVLQLHLLARRRATGDAIDVAVARTADRTGVRPRVYMLDGVDAAVCAGLRRPTVVFSPAFLRGLAPDEVHAVVLHEVAHFQAWDGTRNALLGFVAGLSLIPGSSRMLRGYALDRELAADRRAVEHGADPLALASALVKAARLEGLPRPRLTALPALPGHRCSGLTVRVERLLDQVDGSEAAGAGRPERGEAVLALTVLAAATLTAAGVWGQWGASLHCLVEDLVHIIS